MVNALGADFRLMGTKETQVKSTKPVIAICAVRTGCGKSQTTRRVAAILQEMGLKVAAIRHPMPYGDLVKQRVQRFATYADLDKHECTIEEREEYEPLTTKRFCAKQKRKWMWSSGMAEITTSRSTSLI